ncbi:MAG: biopolymer transporter ExbD [Deltaproteobacteria bacterium]|nr:MAG: biopolymer transporter ExbD [Deltaproteobacteria bacterium]
MAGRATKNRPGLVHKKPAKLDGPRSEINVTPLVDVCLVLLIIFMVITPLLARGKDVPLPRTKTHVKEADKNQPIIAIARDGKVYFDKDHIANVVPAAPAAGQTGRRWQLDDEKIVQKTLEDAWRRAEEQRTEKQESVMNKVFLKADRDLAYGQVYPVMMAIHELGVSAIDLGTNELKEEGGAPAP